MNTSVKAIIFHINISIIDGNKRLPLIIWPEEKFGKWREARWEKPVLCFQVYQQTSSLKPIPDIAKYICTYSIWFGVDTYLHNS